MKEENLVENNKYGNVLNILHLIIFITYNVLIINGIRKLRITKLQKEKNKKNIMKLWIDILIQLFFVPVALGLYWIFLVISLRILTTFIVIITNTEQAIEKNNSGKIHDFVYNISNLLLNNLQIDIKIYAVLFIINFIIIIFLLIILLCNVNDNIDNHYIDRIFTLYQVIIVISLVYLFDLFNK